MPDFRSPRPAPSQSQSQSQGQGSLPFDFNGSPTSDDGVAQTLLRRALPGEPGVWDELRQPSGLLRPAWQAFAENLPPPPAAGDTTANPTHQVTEELDRRAAQLAQQIRRDGVTHNVFSEQGVASRPWSLELLPHLLEAADWAQIEAGVVQRAQVLQAMLTDLYGPQRLLHEGLLPPALLYRHRGWLRPLMGVAPPGGLHLYIVAFDLARGPDGRWWLVSQRTQGPSGLGYVLHNRMLVSRQFPDAFRELRVQHIASSYRRLLDTLEQQAALISKTATPRVVLLTPGPYSETYFEHAYLARYLGLPLVEGGDLTVRNERVFLKTVEGLEPVHGVMRRLDDDWCDPLELRPDSALGVPGLLQAARAGTVVMANALGSAFLESPAIQGFMPGITRRLSGQPLLLPALPTWWCGEAAARQDVRERLDGKVLRSTFPRGGRTSRVHEPGNADIDNDPDAWTVQGRQRFSRAPLWADGSLSLRPAMVRVYAIADGSGGWFVLPGGMTRVAQREDSSVSMQRGGSSLDTWVRTDGAVDTFSMLPQRLQVDDIAQRRRPVSSRTGENLFWLGRYTERTEQIVRLARATLLLIDADNDTTPALQHVLSALAVQTGLTTAAVPSLVQAPKLFERALLAGLAQVQSAGPGQNASSVSYHLAALQRSAQSLRERLTSENWGLIQAMGEGFSSALDVAPGELPHTSQVLPALDRLALQLAALTGAQTDRMTRDHGWRLLTVGRLLERLIGLGARLAAFVDGPGWGAAGTAGASALESAAGTELLLQLFDSLITFRARYQQHEDLLALTDVLVLDSSNPRALAGVLRRLRTELSKLPGTPESLAPLLAALPAEGAGLTLDMLRGANEAQLAQTLHSLGLRVAATAAELAEAIGSRYFTLADGPEQRV